MHTLAHYTLGHAANEWERLEAQAQLYQDPLLAELAAQASHCLEIGSGTGANFSLLANANPDLVYTGLELSPAAVALAKQASQKIISPQTPHFLQGDARALPFAEGSFDFVFFKLVLWSVASESNIVLQEAFRVLKPGGIIYAFEPYDPGVLFTPGGEAFKELRQKWCELAQSRGQNPCIGPLLPAQLQAAGFTIVNARVFTASGVLAEDRSSVSSRHFSEILKNLELFYFGQGEANPIRNLDTILQARALAEIKHAEPGTVISDYFFISIARKP